MSASQKLQALFTNPSPEAAELLLDACAEVPGIVFAIATSGKIVFAGGRDLKGLPFDARSSIALDYRDLLAGHERPLEDIARALGGEEFVSKGEFLGRFMETRFSPVRDRGVVVGTMGIALDTTNQVRTEQELKTSQTLYRTVIETTDTGFVMLDRNGLVVDANEEYLRILGRDSLESLLGRSVTDWTAPHDIERNAEEVEKCLRYGITRHLRVDYLDVHGHIVPIEVNATYVYVDGQPRILALIRDVSERIETEAALKRTESLSQSVLAAVPDAVVVLDAHATILAVNEGWREFVRLLPFAEDLPCGPGGDYLEILRREVEAGMLAAGACAAGLQDVLAGRSESHSQEVPIGDGAQRRWFLKRVSRLHRDEGGVVVTHIDVTERRRQQDAVESSARALHVLLDQIPVGVFQTDVRGECTYVNTTWTRLVGLTPDRALGWGWAEALHPDDRLRVFEIWQRAISRCEPCVAEFRYIRPRGEVMWAKVEVVPMFGPDGMGRGHIGTVTDIGALKESESNRDARSQRLEPSAGPGRGVVPRTPPPIERDARTGVLAGRALWTWVSEEWGANSALANSSFLRLELDPGPSTGERVIRIGAARSGRGESIAGRSSHVDALRTVARVTIGLLRRGDLIGMHSAPGSDGFLIVLRGTDGSCAEDAIGARACAERVRGAVERALQADAVAAGGPSTVSLGVATRADLAESAEELLAAAEHALDAARAEGGNRVFARSELGTSESHA